MCRRTMFGNRWTRDKEDIHDHCERPSRTRLLSTGCFSLVPSSVWSTIPAGPIQRSRPGCGHLHPVLLAPGRVALNLSLPPRFLPLLQLLVGRRRGPGLATDVTLEQGEDGRARHLPAPLSPRPGLQRRAPARGRAGRVASQMNGLICPRTAGTNLSVGAGEQAGLNGG